MLSYIFREPLRIFEFVLIFASGGRALSFLLDPARRADPLYQAFMVAPNAEMGLMIVATALTLFGFVFGQATPVRFLAFGAQMAVWLGIVLQVAPNDILSPVVFVYGAISMGCALGLIWTAGLRWRPHD